MRPHAGEPLTVDFVGGRMAHRRRFGGGRGQPLARAVGVRGTPAPRVVDATAGVGTDAFVLASLGCTVTLIERVPEAATALRTALAEARAHPDTGAIAERMTVVEGDAIALLAAPELDAPEVVYIDPMYPRSKHTAANARAMQRLQLLAGADTDSDQLLDVALNVATRRVVVKRPRTAPCLTGPAPSGDLRSAHTRYDLYGGALLRAVRTAGAN
ncbi:MAG: class I SAM-dependent methyltransferase [Pseudomonadota bacterium]